MNGCRGFLRAAGSAWLGGVVLLLLMLAMACATVYEATHGTPQALAVFYASWWFQGILALLAAASLAAVLARWPWSARQSGLVITHLSVIVVVLGAYVTKRWATDGHLGLAEEQTASRFLLPIEQVVLREPATDRQAEVELDPHALRRHRQGTSFDGPSLQLGDLSLRVISYLPAATPVQRVVNDAPSAQPAVEIILSTAEASRRHWIFANQPAGHAGVNVVYHWLDDAQSLAQRLAEPPATQTAASGEVHFTFEDRTFSFPLDACADEAVVLGDTGLKARVVRVIDHAVVDDDRQIRDDPSRPANPAIEVEITGPEGTWRQMAFARFPDLHAMHDGSTPTVKIVFETPDAPARRPLIELFGAPDAPLHVRFNPLDGPPVTRSIPIGEPIDTPWPEIRFEAARHFDRARFEQTAAPADPHDESAVTAVQLSVTAPGRSELIWLTKNASRNLPIGDTRYELIYRNKSLPLDFQVRLDRFHVGYYPGTQRPRSYESSVTFQDPGTGRQRHCVISMNHPAKHGGYTFFQSSYRKDTASDRWVSFLSVAWDPGKPFAFAGYVGLVAGLVWTAATRVINRRTGMSPCTDRMPDHAQGQATG